MKKIKTAWNLGLLYPKGHKDPAIEKDVKHIEKIYTDFAATYAGRTDYIENAESLAKVLADYETLINQCDGGRPAFYLSLAREINKQDAVAEAMLTKISERLTKASNKIIFFELLLAKIPVDKQKQFLANDVLKPYHYYLSRIFLTARYNLSEAEEKIIALKRTVARELWIDGASKLDAKQTILWKKKELPIQEAIGLISSLPTKERRALYRLVMGKLKEISDFAESEINAVFINKKIDDELRGFTEAYQSRLLGDEMEEKQVKALVDTVTKAYPIAHRFMKVKAKLLKLKRLEYADRNAPIGKTTTQIPFEKSTEIVRKAFARMDNEFAAIFDSYLERGQVDVFPKKGKAGGAFCAGNPPLPTFLLLNHLPDMKSTMTMAHEYGHGIHTEFSAKQPVFYRGYSTAVAEVASNFFENVVFDDVFETLTDKEKIVALHDRINDSVQSIFRQIACFNFEYELHTAIRQKGFVQKEEIAAIMNKHMKAYLGPIMDIHPDDGYFFVHWSHIRNFFYVYSYAYGDLISKALYARYKKDNSYVSQIKAFLSAGGSKTPFDIFNDIGIDTSDPAFFNDGLKAIEADIKKLEKLC